MHDGSAGSPVEAFGQKGGIMQFLYLLSREGEAGRPPKISCPQYAGSCSLHSAIGKRIGSVDANRRYHQLRPPDLAGGVLSVIAMLRQVEVSLQQKPNLKAVYFVAREN